MNKLPTLIYIVRISKSEYNHELKRETINLQSFETEDDFKELLKEVLWDYHNVSMLTDFLRSLENGVIECERYTYATCFVKNEYFK